MGAGKNSECAAFAVDDEVLCFLDASGKGRSFRCPYGGVRHLCFSTHGRKNDDLLGPCFEENENDGTLGPNCFCGLDTPHIHAHLYNPKICLAETDSCDNTHEGNEAYGMEISNVTIDFVEANLGQQAPGSTGTQDCNTVDIVLEILAASNQPGPIKHDTLVLDHTSGNILLAHDCSECQGQDCHGLFTMEDSPNSNTEDVGGADVQTKFFRAATSRENILEDTKDPNVEHIDSTALQTDTKVESANSKEEDNGIARGKKKATCCSAEKVTTSRYSSGKDCRPEKVNNAVKIAAKNSSACCSIDGGSKDVEIWVFFPSFPSHDLTHD